jgi:oxygen-independent coproporphyrinogen-3 oxidase
MNHASPSPQPRLLDARVPRYTSYPPANHFSAATGAAAYAGWLAALPPAEPVSLYVHIPFCRRLCHFCACRTQGTATARPIDRYLDHLAMEVALVAQALPGKMPVSQLHLGGGTPTLLTPAQTARLFAILAEGFDLSVAAEIAVELDPTEIDAARLDALVAAGVTRASLGIQDFEPRVQEAIGRPQSLQQTREAADGLRARGIASLNADVLYGLPYQTTASLHRTLDSVLALEPDRLALFGYAHVPWAARRQRLIPTEALPDGPARQRLFEAARRHFLGQGYRQIGIDHFARAHDGLSQAAIAGRLHRNFQGYTTDAAAALISLGASAISKLPQGYAQNAADTAGWQAAVSAGRLPTARGHAFSAEDLARARAIERLLCDFRVDLDAVAGGHAGLRARLAEAADQAVARLGAEVEMTGSVLRLTRASGIYARCAAAAFDAYLAEGAVPYSLAL